VNREAEVREVCRLLEADPEISRISPDGERLYMMVEGEILCISGMPWNEMSEEQIDMHLELARVEYAASKGGSLYKDT
jgi:hypothetical protein